MKLLLCFFVFSMLNVSGSIFSQNATIQQRTISGVVTDQHNVPLPGVTIMIKGTTIGTVTDVSGNYTLSNIPDDATLRFSFVGMSTQEVVVGNQTSINVTLEQDAFGLEEVIAVGYGTQRRESLTGAISHISGDDITTTTHTSLAQALQGKIAGLQIRQQSGEPGLFQSMINIRGFGSPLYVIDGITRGGGTEFQKLNPEDIESISILKDASAAIYGLNAANGVIIVTTKQGRQQDVSFQFNTVTGRMVPTDIVQMSSTAQFMELMNDAAVNAGGNPILPREELQMYQSRAPGYEGTDWYDVTMLPTATMSQHNLSAQGGSELATYFLSLGYQNEGSLLRSGDMAFNKYTFRTNLTSNLTKDLQANLTLAGRYDQRNTPGDSWFMILKGTRVAHPTDPVYANNNPDFFSNVFNNQHPLAQSDADVTGYTTNNTKAFESALTLTYSFPFFEGLKLRGVASYDNTQIWNKNVSKSYRTYSFDRETESYVGQLLSPRQFINNNQRDNNHLNFQGHLTYANTFADIHDLGVTLVYEQRRGNARWSFLERNYDFFTNDVIDQAGLTDQLASGNELEYGNVSYLGRVTYGFRNKYNLEYAFRYDGSYRYHPDRRWAFFPVVSGAWRISEEGFMEDNLRFISNLKLRASYGQVGQDAGDPFQYLLGFTTTGGGGYEFSDGLWTTGAGSPPIVNEYLTWFKSNILNLGIDVGLFQNKLIFEADVYERQRSGLLAYRNVSLPNTFGGTLPQENLNSDIVRGIEFATAYNGRIGEFIYNVRGNFNFARTMNGHIERAPFVSSWDRWKNGQENRWQGIGWGYQYDGQFTSMDDVIHSPGQNGVQGNRDELPGDFKYVDLNGDGVIDGNDQLPLFWTGNPRVYYGLTMSGRWRGFDFFALFQGSGKYTVRFREVYGQMFAFGGNTPAYFYDRWRMADPYNDNPRDPNTQWIEGKWPPARVISDVGSMYRESDRWRRDASYVRFKNLELGYTFDFDFLRTAGLDRVRAYVNGHNLFTITDPFVKPFDPEKIEGAHEAGFTYPLIRSFNFGVNLTF